MTMQGSSMIIKKILTIVCLMSFLFVLILLTVSNSKESSETLFHSRCNVLKNRVNVYYDNTLIIVGNQAYRKENGEYKQTNIPKKIRDLINDQLMFFQSGSNLVFEDRDGFYVYNVPGDVIRHCSLAGTFDYTISSAVTDTHYYGLCSFNGGERCLIQSDIQGFHTNVYTIQDMHFLQNILITDNGNAILFATDEEYLYLVELMNDTLLKKKVTKYSDDKRYVLEASWGEVIFFYSHDRNDENICEHFLYDTEDSSMKKAYRSKDENACWRMVSKHKTYTVPWDYDPQSRYRNRERGITLRISDNFTRSEQECYFEKSEEEFIESFQVDDDGVLLIICNPKKGVARIIEYSE